MGLLTRQWGLHWGGLLSAKGSQLPPLSQQTWSFHTAVENIQAIGLYKTCFQRTESVKPRKVLPAASVSDAPNSTRQRERQV